MTVIRWQGNSPVDPIEWFCTAVPMWAPFKDDLTVGDFTSSIKTIHYHGDVIGTVDYKTKRIAYSIGPGYYGL